MSAANTNQGTSTGTLNRRQFVNASMAAGAGMALVRPVWAAAAANTDPVNAAIIGVGRQGKILLNLALKVPNLRFKAVCDIWSYSQRIGAGLCKRVKQNVNVYDDYKEMLAKEKDLDVVFIAVPDFWHSPMTVDCLKAGLHVYCEKEMSNNIEDARKMVLAQRETGKLLQIGHQRRSNPYYMHAYRLLHKDKFAGTLHSCRGQWHQLKPLSPLPSKLAERYAVDKATLDKWGYRSMDEFYEWRWFHKYSGGPMCDLGSHQVDIFCWWLDAPPSAVTAIGNAHRAVAEAKEKKLPFTPESMDHCMALYEFNTENGPVHGYYSVNLNSSHGGFYEEFMGSRASMTISEIKAKHAMYRERVAEALEWEDDAEKFDKGGAEAMKFDPLKSRKAKGKMDKEGLKVLEQLDKPAHQPHIENFVATVRGDEKLNCDAEVGFETAVAVLKATESARAGGKRIEIDPKEFKA